MTNALILFCVAVPALIVFFLRVNVVAAWLLYIVLSLLFESTSGYLWLDKSQQMLAIVPLVALVVGLAAGIGKAPKALLLLHAFVASTLGFLVVVFQLPKFSSLTLDATAPALTLATKQQTSFIVFGLVIVTFFVMTSMPKQHKKGKHEK
jgi:hypothetical protein